AVTGEMAWHRCVLTVQGPDDGHRLQAAARHPGPQPPTGTNVLAAVVGRDADDLVGSVRLAEQVVDPVRSAARQESSPDQCRGQCGPCAPRARLYVHHDDPNDPAP